MADIQMPCRAFGPRAAFNAATRSLAEWLGLAAAPVFALMALVTAVAEHDMPDVLCSTMHALPISGMVAMYLLMSVFHISPWLKLMATPNVAAPHSSGVHGRRGG